MDSYERLVHYAALCAESELSRTPIPMQKISDATIHRRNRAVSWIDMVRTDFLVYDSYQNLHSFDILDVSI